MFADDRLTRLRALIARLERLPASPESEWMLREARARMVDVETGERPGEMRPLAVDPPAEPPRPRRDASVKRPTADEPPAPPQPVVPADAGASVDRSAAPFGTEELLWLEDSPNEEDTSTAVEDGDPKPKPWRRGLRG